MHRCIHCGRPFKPNPRVKNQKYCRKQACQRVRQTNWYRKALARDPEYKDNQRRCQKEWHERHPGYYRKYRESHPEYVQRNRQLQLKRNARIRNNGKMVAKIDSLSKPFFSRKGELFRVIPHGNNVVAKIDSFVVKLIPYRSL